MYVSMYIMDYISLCLRSYCKNIGLSIILLQNFPRDFNYIFTLLRKKMSLFLSSSEKSSCATASEIV